MRSTGTTTAPSPSVAASVRSLAGEDRLSIIPRPRGRELSRAELREYVRTLADWPELWIGAVRHDRGQRHYAELLSDDHLTVWLICWMDDHDTGFHDHDVSAGAVAVVGGKVREERLRLEAPALDRLYAAGDVFDFSPADIHRVRHAGRDPAVTLHVYSPALLRMGAYVIDERGVLARRSTGAEEELRPLRA